LPGVKLLKLISILILGAAHAALLPSARAQEQPGIAQQPPPAASPTKPDDSGVAPSWETQKQARTFILSIPAPRGQITDRNGVPLAQNRVGFNLAIEFPTPLKFTDQQALEFAHEQIGVARGIINRQVDATDDDILKHYHNRGMLPMEIALDLLPAEKAAFDKAAPEHLMIEKVYLRFYQNGPVAGHILGYTGRNGRQLEKPVENNDLLWPETAGREGLESTFNSQLTGKLGQMDISIDATGKKVSEKVAIPPVAGDTVVTTLDSELQKLCEEVLSKSAKRGAIVMVDPNNGDILAMASWPVFNPNHFVPNISDEDYNKLLNDPEDPMLPRAYRSAYPPGSIFKVIVGIAALESGAITLKDQFDGPAAYQVGNTVMHNWKKDDAGQLNFHEALEQSCDTWFYQVGIKTGSKPIIDWSLKFGFGAITGIPLRSEAKGRVPTDEYMLKAHGRKLGEGDIANISIGQGDVEVTPLQVAQAMAAVANGGTLYKLRLVKQVQGIDNHIITPYEVRIRADMEIKPDDIAELRKAMVDVVSGDTGTGHKGGVDNVEVAAKTGTAQWGPKNKERNAAWFAGFAPANKPRYAFAVVYEGEIGQSTHGGDYAAPMMGKILNVIFSDQAHPKKKSKQKQTPKPEEAPTGAD
jgi:penicillin-binding protein 2